MQSNCAYCEYDLRGSANESRCPECGRDPNADLQPRVWNLARVALRGPFVTSEMIRQSHAEHFLVRRLARRRPPLLATIFLLALLISAVGTGVFTYCSDSQGVVRQRYWGYEVSRPGIPRSAVPLRTNAEEAVFGQMLPLPTSSDAARSQWGFIGYFLFYICGYGAAAVTAIWMIVCGTAGRTLGSQFTILRLAAGCMAPFVGGTFVCIFGKAAFLLFLIDASTYRLCCWFHIATWAWGVAALARYAESPHWHWATRATCFAAFVVAGVLYPLNLVAKLLLTDLFALNWW